MSGESSGGVDRVPGVDVVGTTTGRVAGRAEGGAVAVKGIPYAPPAPWAPPQPVPAWTGVREAFEFGPQAPQTPGLLEAAFGMADWPMSEDCLSLNVWTPTLDPAARRPVLVFLHGGAFTNGTGAVPWYHGAAFARDGCVLVTLNYRLGALGYLHLADLAGERFAGSGNLGLLDQVAALAWVKANIAGFGGDPANVTIFGESAGGMAVLALMGSPEAKGLFNKVIAESSFARSQYVPLAEAEANGVKLAEAAGVKGTDAAAAAALRKLPLSALAGPRGGISAPGRPYPIVDGKILTDNTLAIFAAGKEARVPLMIGGNS